MVRNNILKLQKIAADLSVLIVEDEDLINSQLRQYLEKFFKVVKTAFDGLEGLACFNKEHFDIVVSDILMPKMNGIEMLQKIKEKNSNQKIVITSASSHSNYLIDAIEMGVNH